jgi:hypothetical protein
LRAADVWDALHQRLLMKAQRRRVIDCSRASVDGSHAQCPMPTWPDSRGASDGSAPLLAPAIGYRTFIGRKDDIPERISRRRVWMSLLEPQSLFWDLTQEEAAAMAVAAQQERDAPINPANRVAWVQLDQLMRRSRVRRVRDLPDLTMASRLGQALGYFEPGGHRPTTSEPPEGNP